MIKAAANRRSGYLLTRGHASPKLKKGPIGVYESVVLHLSPHNSAGLGVDVCPWSTPGCRSSCLYTAGRGRMKTARKARENRTFMYVYSKNNFMHDLHNELVNLKRRAKKQWKLPAARLNGTSDIAWEKHQVPQMHQSIQFWDYTKSLDRVHRYLNSRDSCPSVRDLDDKPAFPGNYHLTFSRSEETPVSLIDTLIEIYNCNVAVVFDTPKDKALPTEWEGHEVIDGRVDDYRFNDPRGVIVGLSALGAARKDKTGFVVRLEE